VHEIRLRAERRARACHDADQEDVRGPPTTCSSWASAQVSAQRGGHAAQGRARASCGSGSLTYWWASTAAGRSRPAGSLAAILTQTRKGSCGRVPR
jgi:hypothetical protein